MWLRNTCHPGRERMCLSSGVTGIPLLTLPGELSNFDIVVRASKNRKVRIGDNDSRRYIFDYTRSTPVREIVEITIGKGPKKKARIFTQRGRWHGLHGLWPAKAAGVPCRHNLSRE